MAVSRSGALSFKASSVILRKHGRPHRAGRRAGFKTITNRRCGKDGHRTLQNPMRLVHGWGNVYTIAQR